MNIKRVFIPTLTAILIASQLCGCAATSQSELLTMINGNQTICIELAEEKKEEQGDEIIYEWIELASLSNYEQFRMAFDDALGITAFGEGGKNGTVYVDTEGNHTNNSTLRYAMLNQKFRDQLENTDINEKLLDAVKNNYVDITSDAEAELAYINTYFNIFEDGEPNFFNGNSSVTRAEFLSALYRTDSPVQELSGDATFIASVDPNDECEHTLFAQQLLGFSYLNLSDKSLNTQTFTGEITRAEAIYTIVKMFYNDKLNNVTGKEKCFSDAKNGGNIALDQKFIEKDKETKELVYKDYWMSYELQHAINNPDKGMPEQLYKAMVVAKQVGLINSDECRWDEAITKNEALNFIMRAYEDMDCVTNADRGTAVGDIIDNSSSENNEGDGTFENPFSDYTKNDESLEGYEVTITEVLDTQMYVTKATDTYRLDNEKAGKIGPVELGAYLTVTGKTSNGWYEVQCGYVKGYLPADVLSTENPIPQEDLSQVYGDDGRTAEEILEAFEKANSSGNLDDIIGEGAGDMEYTGNIAEQYDGITPW